MSEYRWLPADSLDVKNLYAGDAFVTGTESRRG